MLLAEKELEWKSYYVELGRGEQLTPEFLALNPKGVVPVLVHDGVVVTESTIIAEYIEESFPVPALMPAEPAGKARVRYWTKQTDEEIHLPRTIALSWPLALRNIYMEKFPSVAARAEYLAGIVSADAREIKRQSFERGYKAPIFKDAVLFFDALCEKMNTHLEAARWLANNVFTLAEINHVPYLLRLEDLQLSILWRNRPALSDWYARIKARPAWLTGITAWDDAQWKRRMREAGAVAQLEIERILDDARV